MIRLADRSNHGWGVVDEYTADDSDDEKRIERAEKAAEKKAEKRRKKRGQVPGKARSGPPRFPSATQAQVMGMPVPAVPVSQPRRHVAPVAARPVGPCHFCGEMGHLRLHCPARAAATGRKWYPFREGCVVGVDVKHREYKCGVAECVNCVDVKVNSSTCKHIESKKVSIALMAGAVWWRQVLPECRRVQFQVVMPEPKWVTKVLSRNPASTYV